MGNQNIRRIVQQESAWTEKGVARHKHCYDVESVVCIHYADGPLHFHVHKCRFCNSFRCIAEPCNVSGFIRAPSKYAHLETFHLKTTHKFRLGFKTLDLKPLTPDSAAT